MRVIIFLLFSVFCFFISCGNPEEESAVDGGKNSSRTADSAGNLQVFLLPAPLQIPSVLKLEEIKYSEKILEKTQNAKADYQVSYLKALNLGIYSIDMGYTAAYDDHPNMLKYAAKIDGLTTDLNIQSGISSNTAARIQANMNNKDSLYLIILESFRQAHEYFKSNEREDVGLMILTGSFVEGIYIASSLAKENHNKELLKTIGQQKNFLDNIILLLKKYPEQKDIQTIITKMDALHRAFEGVEVSYNGKSDRLNDVSISSAQLAQISARAGEIRNEIIN